MRQTGSSAVSLKLARFDFVKAVASQFQLYISRKNTTTTNNKQASEVSLNNVDWHFWYLDYSVQVALGQSFLSFQIIYEDNQIIKK